MRNHARTSHTTSRDLTLHASAAGKLLLAECAPWQQALPATPLRKLTPHTVTDLAAIDNEIKMVRRSRQSIEIDELEEGLACVAVPLAPDPQARHTAGALCVVGPTNRVQALRECSSLLHQRSQVLAPLIF